MKLPKYLLWLDLETTGSDPEVDCIIEVGCTLTFNDLADVHGSEGTPWEFTSLVAPTPRGIASMFENPVVWNMHTKNGLIDELHAGVDNLPRPEDVADQLKKQLFELCGARHNIALAGSGVAHFDIKFLRKYMPDLVRFLAYPIIDIGVIRRTFWMWAPNVDTSFESWFNPNDKLHRGLADIKLHLEEARYYKVLMEGLA